MADLCYDSTSLECSYCSTILKMTTAVTLLDTTRTANQCMVYSFVGRFTRWHTYEIRSTKINNTEALKANRAIPATAH